MKPLASYLKEFRLRLRLQDGFSATQRTLWVPCALALLAQIFGRLLPVSNLWIWTLAPFFPWLILIWGLALLRPFNLLSAALRVDEAAGLQESLSTAYAFRTMAVDPAQLSLVRSQHQEAIQFASNLDPRGVFPLTWLHRPTLTAAGFLLLAFLSAILPNKMDLILLERQAIKDAAQEQAALIDRAAEDLSQSNDLSPEDRLELVRELHELAEQLRLNPGDLEEALADLSRFDERLRSNLDPSLDLQAAYLEQLARQLAQLSGSQPQSDMLESIQADLDQIQTEIPSLTEEEKEHLTRQIAQLSAQAAQAGAADLRQSLSALAHAMQEGEAQSIAQAFSTLLDDLQAIDREIGDQAAIQQALSAAQSAQAALSNTGRQLAQSQNTSGSQNAGSLPGNLPGSQPGSQPGGQSGSQNGPGTGQPGGGGGSQANTLPPASVGTTQLPSPRGQSQQAQPGLLDQQIYAPWQRVDSNANELFIPGQDTEQGTTTQSQGQAIQPGALNPALIPYSQVYPQYLNAANLALDQTQVPIELRDYVRLYFSSLEPR